MLLIRMQIKISLHANNKKMVIDSIKKIGYGKTIIIISHDEVDPEFRKIEFKQGLQTNNMVGIW